MSDFAPSSLRSLAKALSSRHGRRACASLVAADIETGVKLDPIRPWSSIRVYVRVGIRVYVRGCFAHQLSLVRAWCVHEGVGSG